MKKIGIVGWDTTPRECFGATVPYLTWIKEFGEPCIIMPGEVRTDLDLLVLPGGLDVDSSRYEQAPWFNTSRPNQFLEHFDVHVLPKYIEMKTPIFGICRGMQSLNVLFRGTLNQDIFHPRSRDNEDLKAHDMFNVTMVNGYPTKTGKSLFKTGSWHHQSIDTIGEGFVVDIVAEDNHIEVIHHEELPIIGVQYHPERSYDTYSTHLVNNLLKQ